MEITRKNLVVLGDSFMSPDLWNSEYAGTHWTEKCIKYNIFNLSRPGYSNYNIIRQLHHALENNLQFDFLLIWFTDHRLTMENLSSKSWLGPTLTNCTPEFLTEDQKLAVKYYFTEISNTLILEQTALEILGILSWLKSKNLKFLFNFGHWQGFTYLKPCCSIRKELEVFKNSMYNFSEINLADYLIKDKLIFNSFTGPSYHTKEFWQDHIVQAVQKKFEEVYGD